MNNNDKKIYFQYFDKECCIEINPLSVAEYSVLFNYGCTCFYVVLVRKLLDNTSTYSINHIKNFRVLCENRGYIYNIVPNNRFRKDLYNDENLLISRLIDKSIRSNFPYTEYKYDINILLLNNGTEDIEIATILGVNIALKLYFGNLFNISLPFRIGVGETDAEFITNKVFSEHYSNLFLCFGGKGICYACFETSNAMSVDLLESSINALNNKMEEHLKYIDSVICIHSEKNDALVQKHKQIEFDLQDEHYKDVYNLLYNLFSTSADVGSKVLISCLYDTVKEYINSKEKELQFCSLSIDLLSFQLICSALSKYYVSKNYRVDGRLHEEFRDFKILCNFNESNSINLNLCRGDTEVFTVCSIEHTCKLVSPHICKNILVHYYFNSFACNEIFASHIITRRSIGHGYAIEQALKTVFKPSDQNTFRFVTEVVSADGSTSLLGAMSTSILAHIIDPNTPILIGIGMGLMCDGDNNLILLCDITELEDHFGIADIKIVFDQLGSIVSLRIDSRVVVISTNLLCEIMRIAKDFIGKNQYVNRIFNWISLNGKVVNEMKALASSQLKAEGDSKTYGSGYRKLR